MMSVISDVKGFSTSIDLKSPEMCLFHSWLYCYIVMRHTYKKVKLVEFPILRHMYLLFLTKNEKLPQKIISHSFASLTIEQITKINLFGQ